VPSWNEKPPESEAAFEVEALDAEPFVVELALVAENTGWSDSAWALPFEVFVDVDAAMVVPGPAWTLKVPLAAPLVAVAVVAVAAAAMPANDIAMAATPARRRCFMLSGILK
jgi:hypothetical protein